MGRFNLAKLFAQIRGRKEVRNNQRGEAIGMRKQKRRGSEDEISRKQVPENVTVIVTHVAI